jgi:hypothetical protein
MVGGDLSMAKRTPDWGEYPAWSTARFFGFLRSALRSAYNRYPPKFEVLREGRRAVTGKRHKWEFQCAECKKWHQQKNIQIDHKEPAGKLQTFEDLPTFVKRLFVGAHGLQILCAPCHHKKTSEERKGND